MRSVSDDSLDIRDGGVIAVDTGQLRAAASVLVGLSTRCDALRSTFETGTRELAAHDATAWPAAAVAVDLARVLHELAVEASALAGGLRDAADVYDIVELEVSRRAAADGDRRVTALLDHRIAEARERSPSAGGRADLLLMTWPLLRHGELQRQIGGATVPLGLLGGAAVAAGGLALTALGALGLGRTPPARGGPGSVGGAGPAPLVEVARSAAPPGSASPPLTLATLAERIPREGDQLRVERYTVAGGERRFAVYVAGTRSPLGFGGREPFDMSSNVQLYAGRTSASYESVVTALRAAGARSGDAVLAVGYSQGGAITLREPQLQSMYRPAYFGTIFGIPVPIIVILAVTAIAAFILYRTRYGRHVTAVGSNRDVAKYSGVAVNRVRTIAFVIQGLCVAIAVLLYVPRLGSTSATTGMMWELQAITAVVVGGTALKGGAGRVWGTICGAFILELVGNIMLLSNFISEYLIGAIQGAIIIIAMLVQRSLMRQR